MTLSLDRFALPTAAEERPRPRPQICSQPEVCRHRSSYPRCLPPFADAPDDDNCQGFEEADCGTCTRWSDKDRACSLADCDYDEAVCPKCQEPLSDNGVCPDCGYVRNLRG